MMIDSIRKLGLELNVFSELKTDDDERHVRIVQSLHDLRSVRYLLQMEAFPSILSDFACRRVYVCKSLLMGLV